MHLLRALRVRAHVCTCSGFLASRKPASRKPPFLLAAQGCSAGGRERCCCSRMPGAAHSTAAGSAPLTAATRSDSHAAVAAGDGLRARSMR